MKNTGFTVQMGADGSVVIPEEIREIMGWLPNNSIDLSISEDGNLALCLSDNACVLCGTTEDLSQTSLGNACLACRKYAQRATETQAGTVYYFSC